MGPSWAYDEYGATWGKGWKVPLISFPDPREAGPEGVVAVGGSLRPEVLLAAYRNGIFPWPVRDLPMLWFCPAERGVLEFKDLHIPRSLARARRGRHWRCTIDCAFPSVIRACAQTPRPGQDGTWITPEIVSGYIRLHELGFAHSVEAWEGDRLVGGLYGVEVDGAFSAESMFYRRPNASKLALMYLIGRLKHAELEWMDIQVLSDHMARLGAKEISRDEFLEKLRRTRRRNLRLFSPGDTGLHAASSGLRAGSGAGGWPEVG